MKKAQDTAIVRIKVFPGSKKEGVSKASDGRLLVSVARKAERGMATARAIELVVKHFHTTTDKISLRSGHTARTKTLTVRKN